MRNSIALCNKVDEGGCTCPLYTPLDPLVYILYTQRKQTDFVYPHVNCEVRYIQCIVCTVQACTCAYLFTVPDETFNQQMQANIWLFLALKNVCIHWLSYESQLKRLGRKAKQGMESKSGADCCNSIEKNSKGKQHILRINIIVVYTNWEYL